jgi:hypothetical protein
MTVRISVVHMLSCLPLGRGWYFFLVMSRMTSAYKRRPDLARGHRGSDHSGGFGEIGVCQVKQARESVAGGGRSRFEGPAVGTGEEQEEAVWLE